MGGRLESAVEEARQDISRYGFELEETPQVQYSKMNLPRLLSMPVPTAYYNRVSDTVNADPAIQTYNTSTQQAVLGHELIHKYYRDQPDTVADTFATTINPETASIEEAIAQFYTVLKQDEITHQARREHALERIQQDYQDGEQIATYLETAFTVYDSFDDDPDADQYTFDYLQDRYDQIRDGVSVSTSLYHKIRDS